MRFSINISSVRCSQVFVIANVHLVLILYGLYLTIDDIINQQNPFSVHECTYVICFYLVHFLLIFLLFTGTQKKMPLLYLPWLGIFLAIFTAATCYWIESVLRGSLVYVLPSITNITVLGLGWLSWYTVFKDFIFLYRRYKNFLLVSKN